MTQLISGSKLAQDDDPIKEKLKEAKATFAANKEKSLSYFDEREQQARAKGNKKLVDQIKADRKAFQESCELPKGAPAKLKKRLDDDRRTLEAAYQTAIKEYTKVNKDAEAAAVEKELASFVKPVRDILLPNAEFEGAKAWKSGPLAGQRHKFTLKILERNGDAFKGQITVQQTTVRIEGAVNDNEITFRHIEAPSPDLFHQGRVSGKAIEGVFTDRRNPASNNGSFALELVPSK